MADRSNFDFLEKYDDRVAHLAHQAEAYVHSDPDSSLFKLRLMIETMARTLVEMQVPNLVDSDLSVMLRSLQRSGLLDRQQADQMHAIRRDGNAAVHGHESTPTTALRRLKDAWRLSRWYARIVKRGSKVTTPEFVPPAAPEGVDMAKAEALEDEIESRRARTRAALMLFDDEDDLKAMRWRMRGELRSLDLVAVAAGEPIVDAGFVAIVMAMDLEQILEHPSWGRSGAQAKEEVEKQFTGFRTFHEEVERDFLAQRAALARSS